MTSNRMYEHLLGVMDRLKGRGTDVNLHLITTPHRVTVCRSGRTLFHVTKVNFVASTEGSVTRYLLPAPCDNVVLSLTGT